MEHAVQLFCSDGAVSDTRAAALAPTHFFIAARHEQLTALGEHPGDTSDFGAIHALFGLKLD
jgi:hypothetical protein